MTSTPASSEHPRSILLRAPEVAFTALVCLRHLPFPVGRDLVAGILLGSAEKKIVSKRLDRNPAYGRVQERRGFVRGVLDDLVYEGYIDVKGSAERPTLTLSRRGEEVSRDVSLDDVTGTMPEIPDEVVPPRPAAPKPKREPPPEKSDDEVRCAVAACINGLSFAVGSSKIAEVLTGSRAKWVERARAHELAVYGTVRRSRDEIRKVIHAMTKEGLLADVGRPGRPVLELTDAGRALLPEETNQTKPPEPPKPATPAAEPEPSLTPPKVLDVLIDRLMSAERDEAREIITRLSYFRPAEIAKRLIRLFESTGDGRVRRRALWALGELAEAAGLSFLIARTRDVDATSRALAAAALGKIARVLGTSPAELPATLRKAQQAVLGLLNDTDEGVRGDARQALMAFLPQGGGKPGKRNR